jgi:hypothetical protein
MIVSFAKTGSGRIKENDVAISLRKTHRNLEGVLAEPAQKTPFRTYQLFLRLSRACLGQMIGFSIKWHTKAVVRTVRE